MKKCLYERVNVPTALYHREDSVVVPTDVGCTGQKHGVSEALRDGK